VSVVAAPPVPVLDEVLVVPVLDEVLVVPVLDEVLVVPVVAVEEPPAPPAPDEELVLDEAPAVPVVDDVPVVPVVDEPAGPVDEAEAHARGRARRTRQAGVRTGLA
jgi:hypothetical protein